MEYIRTSRTSWLHSNRVAEISVNKEDGGKVTQLKLIVDDRSGLHHLVYINDQDCIDQCLAELGCTWAWEQIDGLDKVANR